MKACFGALNQQSLLFFWPAKQQKIITGMQRLLLDIPGSRGTWMPRRHHRYLAQKDLQVSLPTDVGASVVDTTAMGPCMILRGP
jgi:hypothetical protein